MISRLPSDSPLTWLQKTIHEAVRVTTDVDPFQLCHLVAATGSYALSTILEPEWHVSAGSLAVVTDPTPVDGGNPFQLEMDADAGIPGMEFHSWIIWVPPTPPGGARPMIDDVLYLDFNSIFYRRWAGWTNIPWNRPDLDQQHPLLGSPKGLAEQCQVWLSAKVGLADAVLQSDGKICQECVREWLGKAREQGLLSEEFKAELGQQITTIKEAKWQIQAA